MMKIYRPWWNDGCKDLVAQLVHLAIGGANATVGDATLYSGSINLPYGEDISDNAEV